MESPSTNRLVIGIVGFVILSGVIAMFLFLSKKEEVVPVVEQPIEEPLPVVEKGPVERVIGTSVEGRVIEAHTYGDGAKHLLFVGGVHGGYEWNSVLLAYQFIDYLDLNPDVIPDNLTVTIIPSLNPDGVFKVVGVEGRFALSDIKDESTLPVGTGRFNANKVDLNRNFDCKWKPESMWRGNVVSAGTSAFSEPEAKALRDFVATYSPTAVIFFHSQANAVYASECKNGILPETRTLMNTYAGSAGYKAVDTFDAYEVTGDAEGWLASINIPAITVELTTHESIEWEKNLLGIQALFKLYGGVSLE